MEALVELGDDKATCNCFSSMASGPTTRFYPTILTLAEGKVLTVGGGSRIPMLYDPILNQWGPTTGPPEEPVVGLTGAEHCMVIGGCPEPLPPYSDIKMSWYPHLYQTLDGRVAFVGAGPPATSVANFTWALSTAGLGSWAKVNPAAVNKDPITGNASVIYGPNLVLKIGGRDLTGQAAGNTPYSIDLSASSPSWTSRNPALHHGGNTGDVHYYLLALPNKKIMALGLEQGDPAIPEWYDPSLNVWADLAAVPAAPNCIISCPEGVEPPNCGNLSCNPPVTPPTMVRGYHSAAALLPDGRVLFVGGERLEGGPGETLNTGHIFSPPYLFNSSGQYLPPGDPARPTITGAPPLVGTGSRFTATVSAGSGATAISSACLIRPGSSTHAFDFDQRYVELPLVCPPGWNCIDNGGFPPLPEGNEFIAPLSAEAAPPGYYMYFVVNNLGVPSGAEFVQVWGIVESSVQVVPTAYCVGTASKVRFSVSWLTSQETDQNVNDRLELFPPGATCFATNPIVRQALPDPNDRRKHTVVYEGPCQAGTWLFVVKSYLGVTESKSKCFAVTISSCPTCTQCPPEGCELE